jgi:hypothetical protein
MNYSTCADTVMLVMMRFDINRDFFSQVLSPFLSVVTCNCQVFYRNVALIDQNNPFADTHRNLAAPFVVSTIFCLLEKVCATQKDESGAYRRIFP